jgi:hypothetical protein
VEHVAIVFLPPRHRPTAASRPRSVAHSFCFYPPSTPIELSKPIRKPTEIQFTTSHRRLVTNPSNLGTKRPLQPQQPRTTYSRRFHTCRHSLVTLGACSATEFSRPPAQLAGFLCPGRARKRTLGSSALPTLSYAVKILLEYRLDSASLTARSYLAQPCDS